MMNSTRVWNLLAIAVAAIWLYFYYGDILSHLDDHFFSRYGDGVKNYFTFAWHNKFDPSWIEFQGMSMPYGEHIGFPDAHPVVSLLVGWIPWVQNHPVAFLNALMLLSILLTAHLLYRLFLRIGTAPFIAFVGSVCLTFMQPQMYRISGHFGLSYSFIVPMTILLCLWIYDKKKWWIWGVSSLLTFSIFLIHPYAGMLCSLFIMVFAAFYIFKAYRDKALNKLTAIQLSLYAIVPVAAYPVFLALTDIHINRSSRARGFLDYVATIQSVFLPILPSGILPGAETKHAEGWGYIGLGTMMLLVCGIVLCITRKWKLSKPEQLGLLIAVSTVPVLFFSMGLPFKLGMKRLLDYLPYVQQFRAPGRFVWVFYYGAGIVAFMSLNALWFLYKEKVQGRAAITGLVLVITGLFYMEGNVVHREIHRKISVDRNVFNPKFYSTDEATIYRMIHEIGSEHALALTMPFFYFGNDFYVKHCPDDLKAFSYVLAQNTGVPLMNGSNPRVSLDESKAMLSAFNSKTCMPWLKAIQEKGYNRFYLVVDTTAFVESGERVIINSSKLLYRANAWQLRTLTLEEWLSALSENDRLIAEENPSTPNHSIRLNEIKGEQFGWIDSLPRSSFEGEEWVWSGEVVLENLDESASYSLIIQQTDSTGKIEWLKQFPVCQTLGFKGDTAFFNIAYTSNLSGGKVDLYLQNQYYESHSYDVISSRSRRLTKLENNLK